MSRTSDGRVLSTELATDANEGSDVTLQGASSRPASWNVEGEQSATRRYRISNRSSISSILSAIIGVHYGHVLMHMKVDILHLRVLFLPFEWIGMNAMLVFVMAAEGIFEGFLNGWYFESPNNTLDQDVLGPDESDSDFEEVLKLRPTKKNLEKIQKVTKDLMDRENAQKMKDKSKKEKEKKKMDRELKRFIKKEIIHSEERILTEMEGQSLGTYLDTKCASIEDYLYRFLIATSRDAPSFLWLVFILFDTVYVDALLRLYFEFLYVYYLLDVLGPDESDSDFEEVLKLRPTKKNLEKIQKVTEDLMDRENAQKMKDKSKKEKEKKKMDRELKRFIKKEIIHSEERILTEISIEESHRFLFRKTPTDSSYSAFRKETRRYPAGIPPTLTSLLPATSCILGSKSRRPRSGFRRHLFSHPGCSSRYSFSAVSIKQGRELLQVFRRLRRLSLPPLLGNHLLSLTVTYC
ncbi:hypothetical protein KSP40_PGU013261 [Platanthera guangdongensis]|uniref:Uncharacterized protein n=1 Tax=Platanthera guangdongensis TaxID=2320717 RepID=A0ABR2M9T8_9ASPA